MRAPRDALTLTPTLTLTLTLTLALPLTLPLTRCELYAKLGVPALVASGALPSIMQLAAELLASCRQRQPMVRVRARGG